VGIRISKAGVLGSRAVAGGSEDVAGGMTFEEDLDDQMEDKKKRTKGGKR